ncbi:MAG: methyltransferase domain-containing protein [Clostridia bacterium]
MSDWNPEKYLLFQRQRTQPAIDLANRVRDCVPNTIVDIGCGPGNSTEVLRKAFPEAEILGIDSSPSMIERAREKRSDLNFSLCSAVDLDGAYDLLFSNACLQWIPNHRELIPQLMEKLTDQGVLAVQMPMNRGEPLYQIIRAVATESKWDFQKVYFETNDTLAPEEYFDILSQYAGSFEQWETVYYHALPSHEHLIDWVRETRLRPYLAILDDGQKQQFEGEILARVKAAYRPISSGEVILKFRRFFFVAHR